MISCLLYLITSRLLYKVFVFVLQACPKESNIIFIKNVYSCRKSQPSSEYILMMKIEDKDVEDILECFVLIVS